MKTYRRLTNTWKDAQHYSLLEKSKSKLQWDTTLHWSEWPSSKSLQTINVCSIVSVSSSPAVGINLGYSDLREFWITHCSRDWFVLPRHWPISTWCSRSCETGCRIVPWAESSIPFVVLVQLPSWSDCLRPHGLQHARHTSWVSILFSSVQFSRSVVSDSLQPRESQHARPPCPSPTPGVHPNSTILLVGVNQKTLFCVLLVAILWIWSKYKYKMNMWRKTHSNHRKVKLLLNQGLS